MICPACDGKLEVVETVRNVDYVYRRRRCKSCGHLIYTTESEVNPDTSFRSVWNMCDYDARNRVKEETR